MAVDVPYASAPDGRVTFAACGQAVTLHPHCVFIAAERVHLGSHVIVSEFAWIHGGDATVIGSFVHLANHSSIAGGGLCLIEDFVGLSAGVRLVTGTELVHGEGLTNPTIPPAFRAVRRSFVHLERHVFLGTNAVVHPGVTIGEGAVVGAGAVVTKDIAPWTIALGVPARPQGKRDSGRIKVLEKKLYDALGVSPLDAAPWCGRKREDVRLPTVS